ncbi:MAG: DUF2099 family protein [archaeon]|nr:DUF2099 family protein [archaeon]
MTDGRPRLVMEALGLSRVTIVDGKVVEVTAPRLKYCPLFNKLRKIEEIDEAIVRENIEFRIREFGLGTENRVVRAPDYVTFGVSEILSTAIEAGDIEAAVIVADGCGTAVVKEPAVVQGLCGRISGIIETTPLQVVLDAVGRDCVIDPETTPIDQVKGAEKAMAMGLKRFAVTVNCPEQARIIREMCGDRVVLVAVHTSSISEDAARRFFEYCDFITACASKPLRDIAFSRDDIVVAGNKVQIFAVTDIGKKLVVDKLHSIGKEPWDGKTPTVDPQPWL